MVAVNEQTGCSIRALAVGRLVPVKDFPLLLSAWQHVSIPLDILGDGPLRSELQRSIEALELSERVTLLGFRHDVIDKMENAAIVVVSSEREGFGYVTLEALQSHCVVVSTKCGVAEDLLPTQYLVNSDANELADAVNTVVDDLTTAQQEFEPVWDLASHMTVSRMVDETEAVYLDLLEDTLK